MTKKELNALLPGVYRIFLKKSRGGQSALASIGEHIGGDKWIALVNRFGCRDDTKYLLDMIKKVELIEAAKWQTREHEKQ